MVGQTVSHYKIVAKLGVGGMGVVYDAEDRNLGRRVALKFLSDALAGDPDATRRLRREAQTIALLNHPHICTVYEIDEYQGHAFIAMERLDGVNLKALLAHRTLTTDEIIDISIQIADALEAAHAKGVIHRDIKPGNVFISEQGQVKVLDFGLARRVPPEDATGSGFEGSTIPGRPVGTANYMAPERILQMPLDHRCDLFSLGVVMYEMATGTLPFAGASPADTVTNVLEKDPPPMTSRSGERPGQLDRVVKKLVAKHPSERYESAAALRTDLRTMQQRRSTPLLRRIFSRFLPGGRQPRDHTTG